MEILWDKKLIRLSNGSYIAWGLTKKKFFFANKNELQMNCAIIEYYEGRENAERKVNFDLKKVIAELEKNNEYAKSIIKALLDNSDEYARQRAIDFLKEVREC